jgi:sugar phosphate isomerase/epimerase
MLRHTRPRSFLATISYLCASAALGLVLVRSAIADESQPTWPVTCRDAIMPTTGQPDCWSALQKVGAEGVEVTAAEDLSLPALFHPTAKYSVATPAGIEQVAAAAKAANQQITAFLMHNRFEEQPEAEIEFCRKLASAAKALGVPVIRIDVAPAKMGRAEFLRKSIDTLKKVMAATESTGVVFAVENHGNTTNDPAFLKPLFEGVGSKRLGLTLDTGNFYWYGHPLSKVYTLYETFAPRAFHTHCKSIGYPEKERETQRPMGCKYGEYACPIYAGDIDFVRVLTILRKAGYHNDLCIEDESVGKLSAAEAAKTLTREVQLLKKLRAEIVK